MPADNAYKFALKLMDYFFTKSEMAESTFVKKILTAKPVLNEEKVDRNLSKESKENCKTCIISIMFFMQSCWTNDSVVITTYTF